MVVKLQLFRRLATILFFRIPLLYKILSFTSKTALLPFFTSPFFLLLLQNQYYIILTNKENDISFNRLSPKRHSGPGTRKAEFPDYPMRPFDATCRRRLRTYTRMHPSYGRSSFERGYLLQCLCRLSSQPTFTRSLMERHDASSNQRTVQFQRTRQHTHTGKHTDTRKPFLRKRLRSRALRKDSRHGFAKRIQA